MSARFEIPGAAAIELEHLVLDVNGTLAHRGGMMPGVAERIAPLRQRLTVHLLSADTPGQLGAVAERLAVPPQAISRGRREAALRGAAWRRSIAIVGPEGASSAALAAAEVVCASIIAALELLLDPVTLASTLRP